MNKPQFKVLHIASIISFAFAGTTPQALASNNIETSLLKSNQSFRSNLSSQPNLDKGEVTMPVQVSLIYIIKQPLPDFITQLASRNKLKLTLSDQVKGQLEKISLPMKLELILPELAKSHGVEWHIQGKHLYVSNMLENTNRMINLNQVQFEQLKRAINNAGLNPGTNKISFVKDKNAVTLIGSSLFISKVESIVRKQLASVDNN